MYPDTHELAALIYANNVDKGVVWAFEKAKEFMDESDRRAIEEEKDYLDRYDDTWDWDSDNYSISVDEDYDSMMGDEV